MIWLKLFALGLTVIAVHSQNINYFGVAFSPYVRPGNWDTFSIDEIKQMLNIILTYHNAVSTYGMGVADYNRNKPWDQADSNCLIARAAAQINRDRNSVVLSVSQGIHQITDGNDQNREIENAFTAAQEANRIFPGTVWGLVFTNEYVTDANNGPKVLDMIRNNKNRANAAGLRVGTRIHICGEIYGGNNQAILKEIVRASDFIMCNLYPPNNSNNADAAVKAISDAYYSARDGFWRENGKIEVMIGETGWASQDQSHFNPPNLNTVEYQKNFWLKMKAWSTQNKVKVQMFEAFDEPWKTGPGGEKHYGWWSRAGDNSRYYTEKSTGKRFQ